MPRRRKWAGPPPPPPATTFIICHPADQWYVRGHHWINEDMVITDRCPMQHIIHLPLKLLLLAQSGSWFDNADDARWTQAQVWHQDQMLSALANGKPRCRAWNADFTQCKKGAHGEELFCSSHLRKRQFQIHRPGAGLDQPSENPLSKDTLEELSSIKAGIGGILFELQRIQQHINDGVIAEWVGNQYAELFDLRGRLDAIVRGDRERDAKLRQELTQRIQRMVERICIARNLEGVDVHMAFIRSGGKKQDLMTIEELKAKVDWLMRNYEDVFPVDAREWQSPDVQLSGMEPGGVRVPGPEDSTTQIGDQA